MEGNKDHGDPDVHIATGHWRHRQTNRSVLFFYQEMGDQHVKLFPGKIRLFPCQSPAVSIVKRT